MTSDDKAEFGTALCSVFAELVNPEQDALRITKQLWPPRSLPPPPYDGWLGRRAAAELHKRTDEAMTAKGAEMAN